jgi:RHS repeat-associated protein
MFGDKPMKKCVFILMIFGLYTQNTYCTECNIPGWVITETSITYVALRATGTVSRTDWILCHYYYNSSTGVWTQKYVDGSPLYRQQSCLQGYACNPLPPSAWDGILKEYNGELCTGIYCGCENVSQLLIDQGDSIRSVSKTGFLEVFINFLYPDTIDNPELFENLMNGTDPENPPFDNQDNLAQHAEPVYLSNGSFGFSATDIIIPGRGLPIIITRTHNSKCEYNSRYGNGWDMNYNMKVRPLFTEDDPGTSEIDESDYIWNLMYLDGQGLRYEFSRDDIALNAFYHDKDTSQYFVLDKTDSESTVHPYALIKKAGTCYYFNTTGDLVRIEDRNDNSITLTYDPVKSDVYGYSRHFKDDGTGEYDDLRGVILSDYKLTQITDSIGNTLLFSYYNTSEPNGDIGLLKTITDQRAGRTWTYKYDLQYNNLITLEKPELDDPYNPGTSYNPTVTYHYDNPAFPQAITSIVDSEQQSTQIPYLENTYEHNPETLRSQVTEQVYGPTDNGQSSTFSIVYDNASNRAIIGSREKVDYQGGKISKSLTITTYNDKGQTVSETVASNPSDDNPAIRAFTTTYEYNDFDQVSKIILPKRNCVEYQYDYLANNFNLNTVTVIQRPECDVLPFNGTSDNITVNDNVGDPPTDLYAFSAVDEDFSIAFWIKRLRKDLAWNEYILDHRDSSGYGWHLYFNSNNKVEFQMLDNGATYTVTSDSEIANSDWHYVVVSVDRDDIEGSINIYIDGGLAEPATPVSFTNPTFTVSSADLHMGSIYGGTSYFQGSLDEVMILNRSMEDRIAIMGLSKYSQGLIGYWKMDDNDSSTLVTDSSDSDKNGVAYRNTEDMVADGKVPGEIKIITTYIQHDTLDYVNTVTDPKGNTIQYTYDFEGYPGTYSTNVGNLMKITYPQVDNYKWHNGSLIADTQNNEIAFTYNVYGQVSEITVPHPYNTTLGYLKTKYEYYPDNHTPEVEYRGRLWKTTIDPDEIGYDGVSIITEYTYDVQGNVNKTILDSGGLDIETSYLYDALDRLEKIIQPFNTDPQTDPYYIAEYQYNKNGKLWKANQKFLDGQSTPVQQTQTIEYGYNLLDNLKTVTDTLGRIIENRYDDNENVIGIIDPEGRGGFPATGPDYQTIDQYDERDLIVKTIDAEGHETTCEYDANGNLLSITDDKLQVTSYTYDNFDRLIEVEYPDGASTETSGYDVAGNVIQKKNRAGDFFYYDYDALNRLTRKIIDDAGGNVVIDYLPTVASGTWSNSDVLGEYSQNCKYSDASGATCQFQCTLPDTGDYIVYLWWPNGGPQAADNATVNLNDSSSTSENIDQTTACAQWFELGTYTFNSTTATIDIVAQGNSKITYADAIRLVPVNLSITEYKYDIGGRILQINENTNLTKYTKYTYDTLGRLESLEDQENKVVEYDYDNLGRRTRLDYPDDTCVTYEYDEMGRLVEVLYDDDINDAVDPVILAHYNYDELSRRTDLYYNYDGDGSYDETDVDGRAAYDYEDKTVDPQTNNNLGNRLQAIRHDINNDGTNELTFEYTYDKVGNSLSKTINGSDPHVYLYDNIYQLTEEEDTQSEGDTYNWLYDSLGNWLELQINTVTQMTFSTFDSTDTTENLLNQYSSVGPPSSRVDYSYDANGNLTGDDTYSYEYDTENRMSFVYIDADSSGDYNTGDTPIAEYTYDYAGKRISKTTYDPTTTTTKYAYDGGQVIAEYDGSDTLLRKFIYGPGIDEPICMITYDAQGDETGRYFYHFDALGSVVALSKFNTSLGYAEFVERYEYSAFGQTTVTQDGSTGNPFRFTGRQWDGETGLYYYRARMYSPTLGRFLQPDPIGYIDGMNLYAYCGNNPLNFIDPLGLCGKRDGMTPEEEKQEIINTAQQNNSNPRNVTPIIHYPGAPWWYWIPNDCYTQSSLREKKLGEWKHWGTKIDPRQKWDHWPYYSHTVIVVWPKGNNKMEPFVLDVWISKWDAYLNLRQILLGFNYSLVDYRVEVYSYEEFLRRFPVEQKK